MCQFNIATQMVSNSYHAAPTTDNATAKPLPRLAHMYGDVVDRTLLQMKLNLLCLPILLQDTL